MFSVFMRKPSTVPFSRLAYTTDCHTHLLPGVDDGRFTSETSLRVLNEMEAEGVREVCLTSHVMLGVHPNTTDELKSAFDRFCAGYQGSIRLHLAAEYMVDDLFLERIRSKDLLCLPDNKILMDMSYVAESQWIDHVLFEVRLMGLQPIIAHPERYGYLADKLEAFDRYVQAGAEFQLNLLSLSGVYGKNSEKIMGYLFEKGYYRYVGSDLHSPNQWLQIRQSNIPHRFALAGEHLGLWQIKE